MADNLLVNRDGVTYQLDLEKRNMLEPTDLLLVNRDGVTYTITGDEIGSCQDIEVSKGVITPSDDVEQVTVIDRHSNLRRTQLNLSRCITSGMSTVCKIRQLRLIRSQPKKVKLLTSFVLLIQITPRQSKVNCQIQ